MVYFISLSGVLLALMVGVVSPGPSFVFIAQRSVAYSRPEGVAAALGMGVGGVAFAGLGLMGLQAVLVAVPWVYAILKFFGGLYLLYLAYKIWRSSSRPLQFQEAASTRGVARGSSFLLGLTTQLSNPKTAIVYGSVFAAMLPEHLPMAYAVLLLACVFAIEAGWYTVVAVALSAAAPRKVYSRYKGWMDRVAAGVMGLLGLKLIASTTSAQ